VSDLANSALLVAAGLIVALAVVLLYRIAVGPTTHDRVVAANVMGTSTVIVIAMVAAGLDRPEYLDIALVYALLNFVLSLAVSRFAERGVA
jgi:multicomponent Na+:H+ antiporter subunit F